MPMFVVADDLGKVLDEVTAERDVQDLRSPADGEHGHVALERRSEQCELRAVASLVHAFGLRMPLGAVVLRIEVLASREEDPVERVEGLIDAFLDRRHDERAAAGPGDRIDVGRGNQRGREDPDAGSNLFGLVARDSDQGSSHVRTFARARSK
jgi:hypothetical protein